MAQASLFLEAYDRAHGIHHDGIKLIWKSNQPLKHAVYNLEQSYAGAVLSIQ